MQSKSSIIRMSLAFGLLLLGAFVWAAQAEAPKKKLSLKDILNSSSKSSKRSATVAGVRGLDETGSAIDTKARDFNAVDKIENVKISDEDVQKFVAEGRLK